MFASITCTECGKNFIPTKKNEKLINESKLKLMRFLMIECQECGQYFSIDPSGRGEQEKTSQPLLKISVRCPVSRCLGWVSHIQASKPEERSFWGCGECGSIWYQKESLLRDIGLITKKYSYRNKCYNIRDMEILHQDINDEINNYEDLVKKEEKDKSKSFVRD